jgi:hypothetical protein
MEEIIARLTAIEERLLVIERSQQSMDDHINYAQENCEAANQRRCDDIDGVRASLRDLESTLHYEISRVRDDLSRSGSRGW